MGINKLAKDSEKAIIKDPEARMNRNSYDRSRTSTGTSGFLTAFIVIFLLGLLGFILLKIYRKKKA